MLGAALAIIAVVIAFLGLVHAIALTQELIAVCIILLAAAIIAGGVAIPWRR